MAEIAVVVEGLGKRYRIGGPQAKYGTLRDTLMAAAKQPITRIRHPGNVTANVEDLWALKDVSFEVPEGHVLGIIGRNGAGKSTLLKVLSRITEPTRGRAVIRGRVGSLLEVGTGFHPELTGRENIYLNGAILGMTRAEIASSFDEIVAFSEMERFLDTPVKRYSSGMYVRLAFAVAAHFEPEILIVDEVLSVGDAVFQRKCLGRMQSVASDGRTVVFVSHNMQAVRSLCTSAVELEDGGIVNTGSAGDVVDSYLRVRDSTDASIVWPAGDGPGDADARLASISVLSADGEPAQLVKSSENFRIRMEVDVGTTSPALCIGFDLVASDGATVFRSYQTDLAEREWPQLHLGRNALDCLVPPGLLNEGVYRIFPRVSLHCIKWIVQGDAVVSFEVHRDPGESPYTLTARPGTVAPLLKWLTATDGDDSSHAG